MSFIDDPKTVNPVSPTQIAFILFLPLIRSQGVYDYGHVVDFLTTLSLEVWFFKGILISKISQSVFPQSWRGIVAKLYIPTHAHPAPPVFFQIGCSSKVSMFYIYCWVLKLLFQKILFWSKKSKLNERKKNTRFLFFFYPQIILQ